MIAPWSLLIEHEFARIAFVAILLVCFSGGLLSPSVVLKQRSFWGDALSHLVFPGVILGLLFSELLGLPQWICMVSGAAATALLGSFLLPKIERILKIPADSAGVVLLTCFFAIGMILSSKFSDILLETNFDLHRFLFGDVLTLGWLDLVPLGLTCAVTAICLVILRPDFDAWIADAEFAKLAGFRTRVVEVVFPVLVTATLLCGIFTVGSLMISALITLPAVLTQPRSSLARSSVFTSLLIGILGTLAGFAFDLPMGPSLVLCGGVLVLARALVLRGKDT